MNQPTTMNQLLAAHYGTNGGQTKVANAPSAEDLEKAAQMDLFAKMAAANNIDLGKLSDAQIEQLYTDTFSKTAGEMPPQFAAHAKGKGDGDGDEDDKKDLEEKAKKEHEEKKEAMAKSAEADWVGRQMAHAYVQELGLIAQNAKTAAVAKTATPTTPAGVWSVEIPKLASAIDTLAISRAFEMIQEFNKTATAQGHIDEKLAAEYIVAAHTKGLAESEKVASAADHKAAVEVRALETLEAIGLKVNWT